MIVLTHTSSLIAPDRYAHDHPQLDAMIVITRESSLIAPDLINHNTASKPARTMFIVTSTRECHMEPRLACHRSSSRSIRAVTGYLCCIDFIGAAPDSGGTRIAHGCGKDIPSPVYWGMHIASPGQEALVCRVVVH